jgi:hypothetical protein
MQLDLSAFPGVSLGKLAPAPPELSKPMGPMFPTFEGHGTPPPETRTLHPKLIHHQAMSKLKVALKHVHTEEELHFLESGIDAIM